MKNKLLIYSVSLYSVFILSSSYVLPNNSDDTCVLPISNSKSISPKDTLKKKEIGQKELFDMIRKGVVSIKVMGHLALDRYDKLWSGTGFIVDLEKGLIVTNAHVAGEMSVCTYEIKFGNGKTTDARLEYIDPCYDIAVLSIINKDDIPSDCIQLEFSDEDPSLNMAVYSMGSSYGNEFSTYHGTIFDTTSILWLKTFPEQSLQFSGLTVPGASGSPVFGADGKVVGLLYGGDFASGAALPIKYVEPVVNAIKNGKQFQRYFYGFMVDYMSLQDAIDSGIVHKDAQKEYEEKFPNANNKILLVTKKLSAFPETKEIQAGDIIWKIDDELIGPNLRKFDEMIQKAKGSNIEVIVYRDGKQKKIEIPTYKLKSKEDIKLLSFAGAVFFETNVDIAMSRGTNEQAVYIRDAEPGSAFSIITGNQHGYPIADSFQITELDGERIKSIDDVVSKLKDLFKKSVFNIKYIKVGGDGEEISITTKYNKEFIDAVLYSFDSSKKSWEVKNISNPLHVMSEE